MRQDMQKMAGIVKKLVSGLIAVLFLSVTSSAGAQTAKTGKTGLPVPRFVTLKSDAVNVRRGPSRDHDVVWRYVRSGLPVEITQEFENWRRIRDFEGAEGWVFHSLLSSNRSALVAPWDKTKTPVNLYSEASKTSSLVSQLEPGVQGSVSKCDGHWCKLEGKNYAGWVEQNSLWGVYPDETFD